MMWSTRRPNDSFALVQAPRRSVCARQVGWTAQPSASARSIFARPLSSPRVCSNPWRNVRTAGMKTSPSPPSPWRTLTKLSTSSLNDAPLAHSRRYRRSFPTSFAMLPRPFWTTPPVPISPPIAQDLTCPSSSRRTKQAVTCGLRMDRSIICPKKNSLSCAPPSPTCLTKAGFVPLPLPPAPPFFSPINPGAASVSASTTGASTPSHPRTGTPCLWCERLFASSPRLASTPSSTSARPSTACAWRKATNGRRLSAHERVLSSGSSPFWPNGCACTLPTLDQLRAWGCPGCILLRLHGRRDHLYRRRRGGPLQESQLDHPPYARGRPEPRPKQMRVQCHQGQVSRLCC